MDCSVLIYPLLVFQILALIFILSTLYRMTSLPDKVDSYLVKKLKPLGFYKDRAYDGRVLRDDELPLDLLKKRYPKKIDKVNRILKEKEIENYVNKDMEYYNSLVKEGKRTYPDIIKLMPPYKSYTTGYMSMLLTDYILRTDNEQKLRILLKSKYYQEEGLI